MIINCQEIVNKGNGRHYLSEQPQTVCEIFRYEPENIEQAPLGDLYAVTELRSIKDCGYLTNLLASLIKREYYRDPSKGVFQSFQSAIKKANAHLSEMRRENPEWLSKLHFFCAAVADGNLLFTQTGQMKAYFCREGHFSCLSRRVPGGESRKAALPAKIFGAIVSGSIEPKDKLLIATPAIENIMPMNDLKASLAAQNDLPAIGAELDKFIDRQKNPIPLAILLIKAEEEKDEINEAVQNKKITTPPIDLNELLG